MSIDSLSRIEDLLASGNLELANFLCESELHRLGRIKNEIAIRMNRKVSELLSLRVAWHRQAH